MTFCRLLASKHGGKFEKLVSMTEQTCEPAILR